MPVYFWNDPDGALYHSAYFDKFEGVWAHGDFLMVDPTTGGMTMLGRSDGTLNPNGVRFGSAEIYNIVEPFEEVADSLCVGQRSPIDGEERVILFLKMSEGQKFEQKIVEQICREIRSTLSARHVPSLVLPIEDIPYTVNGKKVEVAVKQILAGMPVKNAGALANPQSLELFKNIPETKVW
jgi:acetoacetyl-CoA synthetase